MKLQGILVAGAALALLAAAPVVFSSEAEGDSVKCQDINSCAGKGECGAADGSHDCGGKNSCKGKGWIKVDSAEECTDKGGTVLE
jgi:hypothetical protein